MIDTWTYHYESLKETRLLFEDPKGYFTNIFSGLNFSDPASFFSSNNSYWNDLKWNAYTKLISLFNCFSFGNYYINVIFYSYLSFFGVIAVYRVIQAELKAPTPVMIVACFLVPSFIYWCSGLHKDGLSYLGISIIVYSVYFGFIRNNSKPATYLAIIIGVFILFILRNHILVVLLPAVITWLIAAKLPYKKTLIFVISYVILFTCFFGLRHIDPRLDFPAFVAEKQDAFIRLNGNTSLEVEKLDPSFAGFIRGLPQAVSISAFRPYFRDIHKPIIIPAFIELVLIWAMILFVVIFRRRRIDFTTPFSLFCLFFCASLLLIVGYSVNNIGATARYRSIVFPLIIPFFLHALDLPRLLKYIKFK